MQEQIWGKQERIVFIFLFKNKRYGLTKPNYFETSESWSNEGVKRKKGTKNKM